MYCSGGKGKERLIDIPLCALRSHLPSTDTINAWTATAEGRVDSSLVARVLPDNFHPALLKVRARILYQR